MSVVNTIAAKKWAAAMADYKKKGYVVLSVLITFLVSYYFYTVLNRPVAGVLFFIGGGIIFFYYWVMVPNTTTSGPRFQSCRTRLPRLSLSSSK